MSGGLCSIRLPGYNLLSLNILSTYFYAFVYSLILYHFETGRLCTDF